jgi:hypothetical protein
MLPIAIRSTAAWALSVVTAIRVAASSLSPGRGGFMSLFQLSSCWGNGADEL